MKNFPRSIRTIMEGRRVYAPELIDMAYDNTESPLTKREEEVIRLIADGKSTKEIAGELFITNRTVRHYISVILDKLNRIDAVSRFKEKDWFK